MNELIFLFVGGIGALLTYVVAHDLKQGVVRASAGLSLMVGLFFYGFPEVLPLELTINIPIVFLGASFVGMTGSQLVKNRLLILIGGLIFSGVYIAASNVFVGYGGKLGTTACISSLIVFGVGVLIKKFQTR
ncbi:MAG: hypothetical protein HRT58_11510 [Crocinitomicaceae bacterium]|nr:hypothetical protein [Flavobacteriales bacterium]NQZ36285.1 hypothetical protein [Crocinitomicaceae bacterium]